MEFVWMRHDGVANPAKIPASAVPHWEGCGWQITDPPPRPVRKPLVPTETATDEATPETRVDPPRATKPKTTKAPSGRKED